MLGWPTSSENEGCHTPLSPQPQRSVAVTDARSERTRASSTVLFGSFSLKMLPPQVGHSQVAYEPTLLARYKCPRGRCVPCGYLPPLPWTLWGGHNTLGEQR